MTTHLSQLLNQFDAPCLLPPRARKLWGIPHTIQPALCKERAGNGKRLLALQPLNDRPAYYLIWVDDSWKLGNTGDAPFIIDHLETIYEIIEEEFGRDEYENEDGEMVENEWPGLNTSYGCSWWEADEDDILPNKKTCPVAWLHELDTNCLALL